MKRHAVKRVWKWTSSKLRLISFPHAVKRVWNSVTLSFYNHSDCPPPITPYPYSKPLSLLSSFHAQAGSGGRGHALRGRARHCVPATHIVHAMRPCKPAAHAQTRSCRVGPSSLRRCARSRPGRACSLSAMLACCLVASSTAARFEETSAYTSCIANPLTCQFMCDIRPTRAPG